MDCWRLEDTRWWTAKRSQMSLSLIPAALSMMQKRRGHFQTILEMAEYKKAGSCKALIVTGCLAQRYKQEIIDEIEEVDAVLGTTSYDKIVEAIDGALAGGKRVWR